MAPQSAAMAQDDDEPVDARTQGKRDAAKLARQVAANDVKWLMAQRQGRRLMHRWLGAAQIYRTSYVAGDPNGTAYREGMRAFGLLLLGEVTAAAPEDYMTMLQEATKQ